jgi:hypothetical protein
LQFTGSILDEGLINRELELAVWVWMFVVFCFQGLSSGQYFWEVEENWEEDLSEIYGRKMFQSISEGGACFD